MNSLLMAEAPNQTLRRGSKLATDFNVVEEGSRPDQCAADDHPKAARHFAPHNQRLQQTMASSNKLAFGLAPGPQRLALKYVRILGKLITTQWQWNLWQNIQS